MSLFAFAALAAAAGAAPAAEPQPFPDYKPMRRMIQEADARLFWAAFEGCDPGALNDLVHPDFRMIHDQGGLAVANRDDFIASLTEQCAARAEGGQNAGYKNRRLLTPGTRIIRPMGQWGALEEGTHSFYELHDGEWVQTGGARYMHVWQWMPDEGRFRLAESLSYDHGAAGPYPPPSEDAAE